MWKRNQSMMAEMTKFSFINKVIFINPDMSLWHLLQLKKKTNGTSSIGGTLFPKKNSIKIVRYTPLHILPFKYRFQSLEHVENKAILRSIRRINAKNPYIIFMNCPNILYPYPLDELLPTSALSFFDFSDDFVELTTKKKSKDFVLTNITKYAQLADTVLAVNEHLKAKYSYLNKNIHVFKNATNYYNFDRKNYRVIPFLEKLKSKGNPIIGYSGIANEVRIDSNLLDYIAKKRPDWQFVFIGPTNESLIERYLNYKNFQFIPPVDYQSLPDYIHYFDVAIVPFKKNEHTIGNNLLKFHDYLAMGKPVVSTNVGGATDFKDVLMIADGPFDFLLKIEKSLHSDTPADNIKRKNVALENSWHRRIKEVEGLIRDSLKI